MPQAYRIEHGDVLEVLRTYPDNHFHGLLCDPPYGLSFMGKKWDYAIPKRDVWAECLRVLRPGAPLLAFGGSRTFHRLAVEIEDAGFELRDTLMWIYGSGFPKSLDVSKAIDDAAGAVREVVGVNEDRLRRKPNGMKTDGANSYNYSQTQQETNADITAPATDAARAWSGYGTALKPAHEPILLARKPLDGTVAANVARWGVGGLAIDASRVFTDWSDRPESWKRSGHSAKPDADKIAAPPGVGTNCHAQGRWPANVLFDREAGAALDAQTGIIVARNSGNTGKTKRLAMAGALGQMHSDAVYRDSGGASRFFYCAKASRSEREKGCEARQNNHPTVKPLDLVRYLARLILPPTAGAELLVPFSGSGSEVVGGLLAGWESVVGIERELEYVRISRCRIFANHPKAKAA